MTEINYAFWLTSGLAGVACTSALVLSLQRVYLHKTTRQTESGPDPSPIRLDHDRDLTVPFADVGRLPRLVTETSLLCILAAYQLYNNVKHDAVDVHSTIAAAFSFVTWLYCLTLSITARQHKLPSEWGWVLNVHLFFVYLAGLVVSINGLWTFCRNGLQDASVTEGMLRLLSLLLLLDMTFVTGTTDRGQPFLDENGKRVSGVNVASIIGFTYFTWLTPLVRLAHRNKTLTDEDLPTLPPIYRGYNLFYFFGESQGKKLLYRIWHANRLAIVIQIITAIISSLFYYAPAFFVNQLLLLIQDMGQGKRKDTGMTDGFLIVLGLGGAIIVLGIIVGQLWYFAASNVQVRIKAMLNIEIYRKTLRRLDMAVISGDRDKESTDGKDNEKDEDEESEDVTSTGQVVNLMSTDSNRISEFSTWWFSVIAAPTELAVGIYFLYKLLGLSCFLGLSVMIVCLPINHYNAKLFAKTQDQLMDARDKRVSLMNEVLQGIRQIKFFASESNWEKRIMQARGEELKFLRTTYICEVLFTLVWQGSPLLVTIISFWSYTVIQGNDLTAATAFTSIAIFNELRFALNALPETFIEFLQALISVRRIQLYLEQDEIVPPPPMNTSEEVRVGFNNATVTWSAPVDSSSESSSSETTQLGSSDVFTIRDINLQFPNNELSLICGATGSGKSLLLLSLLGETVVTKGSVSCPRAPIVEDVSADYGAPQEIPEENWILDHALAYVSQTAWLQNASIRDNILFGLPYVEKRYKDTLVACALHKDLSYLDDGDMTEIGEKGITLSGGQKARVALARAVYSRAKNVLMDDVLSAVDAHTAKHLYEKCLLGPLMRDRTRVLITHHVKLCLNGTAFVVHVQGGRIEHVGTPAALRQTGELAEILDNEKEQEETDKDDIPVDEVEEATEEAESAKPDQQNKKPKALVEEETRAVGKVKLRLYKMYLTLAGKWFFWAVIILFVFGSRGLDIAESWWIKKWTQANAANGAAVSSLSASSHEPMAYSFLGYMQAPSATMNVLEKQGSGDLWFYLGVYMLITVTNIIIGTGRFAALYVGVLRASRSLYAQLLHRVFRAPLRFFDTTPVGRILNRFSKDFETVDSTVPNDFMNFIVMLLTAVSNVITVSAVLPIFIGPMIIIAGVNIAAGMMFVSTSRELKRIDSVSRSPLFSHFSETIVGVATIRAFGVTRQFLQEMLKRVDTNARPFYYVWVANRWVSMRFSLLGAAINVFAGLLILASLDHLDASAAGFCLSFILMFSENLFWCIRRYTSMEMSFNAVERVVEFMEMDQEAPAVTELRPPSDWPTEGRIQVQDLEVRYAPDLDPVLKGLTFEIKPQEKVGVVGRTGSGKSTMALSFFRFVEATRGSIVIDNLDIKDMGTEDLRSSLTIIPQDPTLFSGTLRSNMDPFEQFSDDDIFVALRRVHLLPSGDDFEEMEGVNANVFRDLETNVSEGGKNFSQGQRQLLCLARALLKRSRIVLMDEATASVDFVTDKAIQKTIASEFADCTILCIAHRLHTVIEYDRILVLDQGNILEFASPLELIQDTNSAFYKMCRKSGEFDSLLALAKAKHQLVDVQ
ncbi:P-loop containing nucleoside triphosphate hydrolase protein [Syncephalastrum racemosum]|uniref:P-loop containing nucleoside triphosphate hydrolase protein n=1 Tax=Syncephalastrum racemosum TaxID=13706 RepID=A0A1X2H1M9_SYNRA|nr:P-loop containing nucleoside triphosphate hydrolase protein [Syncephalastrum racemosum]